MTKHHAGECGYQFLANVQTVRVRFAIRWMVQKKKLRRLDRLSLVLLPVLVQLFDPVFDLLFVS